jgi:pSer/pThr/pTyr-binding forkhead associated (FHA) protein
LAFADGTLIPLVGERVVVGRYDHDLDDVKPEVDLSNIQGADTVSRVHASLQHIGSTYTLTDLRSTNATRLNNQRLEPDKPTPLNDGDTIAFGKVTCTFKKG